MSVYVVAGTGPMADGPAAPPSACGPEGYLADYDRVLGGDLPSLYHVEDTWANFDKLTPVLDQRFADWKRRRA